MSEDFGSASLRANGSKAEMHMLQKLVHLMNKEEEIDFSVSVKDKTHNGCELAYSQYFEVTIQNAVFGTLDDRGDQYSCRYMPSCDLRNAPVLFAALFPKSTFKLSLYYDNNSCSEPDYAFAKYDGKQLLLSEVRLEFDGYDEEWQTIKNAYAQIKCPAEKDINQWIEEWEETDDCFRFQCGNTKNEDYEAVRTQLNLDSYEEVDEMPIVNLYVALSGYKEHTPRRDSFYEKSFFDEGDLQEYLVLDQMKEHNATLIDYIKSFPFTADQLRRFLDAATENEFGEMSAFLLEEIHQKEGQEAVKDTCESLKEEDLETEIVNWLKEYINMLPLKDIQSHFSGISNNKIQYALDRLTNKGILFVTNARDEKMYLYKKYLYERPKKR